MSAEEAWLAVRSQRSATDGSLSAVAQAVVILYTNHRGETAERTVVPRALRFGRSPWHDGEQWFLDAFDLERDAERSFAVRDIHRWFDNS